MFYGMRPESYAEAGRRWAQRNPGPFMCVGIRSIGTSLAASVAVGAGVNRCAGLLSLRPSGHPFRRIVRADRLLRQQVEQHAGAHFAVVDEGPGLSGSTFASVGEWLADCGVPLSRIHFFPSHAGRPGKNAPEEVRRIWAAVGREVADSAQDSASIDKLRSATRGRTERQHRMPERGGMASSSLRLRGGLASGRPPR